MHVPETEIIVSIAGAESARHLLRPGEYVLGRAEDADLRIEAELVSQRHARLTINYDHALIEDLGSSNGTFVNGQPVADSTRLWPGQKIQVGAATIELHRLKADLDPEVTLPPVEAAVQRLLPEELRHARKYDIGGAVARGGMGAILEAREAAIERRVAMKVMLDTMGAEDIARFVAEAKITGQLEHPNIVPVHELGVDENGHPFYTMKMVRGITLRKVLDLLAAGNEGTVEKYPLTALLTIFQKVCDAVAFAHSRGVIHRDLKPENIMLDDFGVVLVMDWGLAKVLGSGNSEVGSRNAEAPARSAIRTVAGVSGSTQAGTIMGTPQYMSPEQANGEVEALDARTDLYALGAIFYHLLALRPPVTGATVEEILEKVRRGEVAPLQGEGAPSPRGSIDSGRGRPSSLLAVVRKAMALRKEDRYASVPELQAELAAYQGGFATAAENASLWRQTVLLVKRHQAAALGLAAVFLVGATFGTKALIEGRRAEREAARAQNEANRANHALADLKKSAPALRQLAESEAGFQHFDSALEKLDAAIALAPEYLPAYWRRAWLLLGIEKYADAAFALHAAQFREPKEHTHDPMIPLVDALASAPDAATRFPPERAAALFKHLTLVGATGELTAISKRLMLDAKQNEQLVRRRLKEWLGKDTVPVTVLPDGTLLVRNFPKTIDTLEPLRGLPIGQIELSDTIVKSLEPLRGMPLTKIVLTPLISDLGPLRGMPLAAISANGSPISDLGPLVGAPLRTLGLKDANFSDINALRGAPLEELSLWNCKIRDFSPLRGAPLRVLTIGGNECADLSFLANAPLQRLTCNQNHVADLTPLRGKPLKFLNAWGNKITDLRPIGGLPLTELIIHSNPITDFSPLMKCVQLEKLRASLLNKKNDSINLLRRHPTLEFIATETTDRYRPVAEFWAEYDAQQAAGKK